MIECFILGRAKPVPPPRSHSLEQSKISSSSTSEEGSDISTNPSTTAKNENLIAGKIAYIFASTYIKVNHAMNFLLLPR